eukprot:IDg6031t1
MSEEPWDHPYIAEQGPGLHFGSTAEPVTSPFVPLHRRNRQATPEGSTSSCTYTTARIVDVPRCMRKEKLYVGMPDEDFDAKAAHFRAALDLAKVTEEQDKLTALPFFLTGQAAMTFQISLKKSVATLDEALKILKDTFLSEKARRANDKIWESVKADEHTVAYMTRTKLLYAVRGIDCFMHVRANPPENISTKKCSL